MQIRLFDRLPDPVDPGVQLREYQKQAVEGVFREWGRVDSTMGVAFTGAGKTTIAGAVAKRAPGRGLFLANRDFLLDQMRRRVEKMTGENVSVEKAEQRMDASRMVVGSIQTLKGRRLERLPTDTFDWIIYDECHHAASNGSRKIFEHFPRAKRLGITATPLRLDRVGMWNAFESVAFEFGMDFGMSQGYFLEPVPVARYVDSVDLSQVATAQGDLVLGGLEEQIVKNAAKIAHIVLEDCTDYQTLVYTPGVASAHAVAATLNEFKPGKAVAVDADTPKDVREKVLESFDRGDIQYIVNCAIYVEGLDVPKARAIVIARPTKSESLYKQMAGRGGRPEGWIGQLPTALERLTAIASSQKPNFLLLDITGHAGRHSLVSSADALAGKQAGAVGERVAKLIQANKGKTLSEVIDQAKAEVDEEDKLSQKRLAEAAAAALVKSRKDAFDPFRKLGAKDDVVQGEAMEWAAEPATAADVAWLKENRLASKDVTHGAVAKLQAQAKQWRMRGMASFRQRKILLAGHCPVDVTFATASRLIDIIVKQGYRPLSPNQIAWATNQRVPGEEG